MQEIAKYVVIFFIGCIMLGFYVKNQEKNYTLGENSVLLGPHYVPVDGNVKSIVVMLHGFGSNGEDLISLAPMLADDLPTTAFYSPNGPEETQMGMGYQWFGDNDFTFVNREGIGEAATKLEAYVDYLAAKHSVPHNKVVLLGFSQGTMTSLFSAPRFKNEIAGVIGFSGRLMWSEELKKEPFSKMPILLSHGKNDDVVPFESSEEAQDLLSELGFEVELQLNDRLMHGIDERGIKAAKSFLAEKLQ